MMVCRLFVGVGERSSQRGQEKAITIAAMQKTITRTAKVEESRVRVERKAVEEKMVKATTQTTATGKAAPAIKVVVMAKPAERTIQAPRPKEVAKEVPTV